MEVIIILFVFAYLFYYIVTYRNPIKTETNHINIWGTEKRKIKYHDSGKEVRQSYGCSLFGTKKTTCVDKECYSCGSMVRSDKKGKYHCCGRTFK